MITEVSLSRICTSKKYFFTHAMNETKYALIETMLSQLD